MLFFILFYNVPAFVQSEQGMLFIYMLLMYILTGTLDSLVNANYGALFPDLFRKDEDRAKVNGIRQICQLFAMAISIALTPMITEKIGYQLTSVIYGVLALAVMMYCFLGCHEPMDYEDEPMPKLFDSILALIKNPRFWIFGFAGAFYSAAFSLISQALPFFVKYTLGLGGSTTTLMLGIAACLTTMDCIGAKIVDDDYRKYGIRREGIINSLGGVMNRLNGLYTSLAFYVASSAFGFVNGDDPGPNPGFAARILLCVFPFAAMVIASVITFFLHFPADETASSENG